jgi:hypothetical protein
METMREPRPERRDAAIVGEAARSIVDWCVSIADRPHTIDRYIDYFSRA